MRNKIVVLLALVAVTGFAAAGALTVKQRQETASLHAERFSVGERFIFEMSALSPIVDGANPSGIVGAPVEITSGYPMANTKLTRDHWQYSVRVTEAGIVSALPGQYLIELHVNGVPITEAIVIGQSTIESNEQEGVVAVFDLGETVDTSSLYYVMVKPYEPPSDVVSYTVRSGFETTTNRWIGEGSDINNVYNPGLTVAVGESLSLTARNGDGAGAVPHNIGIRNAANELQAGWSGVIDADAEQVTLTWTPQTAGTFKYVCQYHPTTMIGDITVSSA